MNVLNKVTLQSLRRNKTRTIVTVIGIMLSAAMICAVTTFVSSMQNYALNYAIYNEGDWHGAVYDTKFQEYQDINKTGKVVDSTYAQLLGYAKIHSRNEFKPYLYVMGGDKYGFFQMLPVHLISGRLPQNATEIILPEHLSSNGGINYKIGDTIRLEIGDRMLDGFSMGQNNPCYTYDSEAKEDVLNEEVIEVRETRTYTVVGIYERPNFEERTAPGYTALTVADEKFSDGTSFDLYFKMKNPEEVYDFMERMELGGSYNTDVLLYSGISRFDSFSTMLMSLAAIVIGLIMFGSISLIYNAFSISVSERTKQFGLLSSIGATKKQLKKMVIFEALAVSAVGIPLGIIVGIGGIGVTLFIIGDKFSSLMGNGNVDMTLCVSWAAVIIAVLVALVTVLISSWIPSQRATRVSAVEAIRQNSDIKSTGKAVKTSKLTYMLFGLSGMIASKHYKRNKRKYRTTIVSLFMSIVLFVSASAFTGYLMESVGGGIGTNEFDLWYTGGESDFGNRPPEEILALIKSAKDVTNATYVQDEYLSGVISKEYLNKGVEQRLLEGSANAPAWIEEKIADQEYNSIMVYSIFIPDGEFKALCQKYNLREEKFMNPEEPLAIAIDGNVAFDLSEERYVTTNLLKSDHSEVHCAELALKYSGYNYMDEYIDKDGEIIVQLASDLDLDEVIEVPYEEAFLSYTMKSGKTIYDPPYYVDQETSCNLKLIYPESLYETVIPEGLRSETKYYEFLIQSKDHVESCTNIAGILYENGLPYESLYDYAAGVEENRNLITIIRVFAYGFIILISLIAAANVFNTISTNISLRRREFAMLKSVGMTRKGFNRMMNFECLLYGSKALLLGLPVSCGITYLIYLAIMEGFETRFHLPWGAIGIAMFSVFLVVFVTMMYSMSKIKKDNPIDTLKNENL